MSSRIITLLVFCLLNTISICSQNKFEFGTNTNPSGKVFSVDSHGFIVDGHHILPVMGEIHYSRIPAAEWKHELRKMKAGGVTMIATYVFWIHHEVEEGKWNWSGNNDLHLFLSVCREEGMPVILRIGPFCHGEVYQGGIPEWIQQKAEQNPKEYKLRSEAPGFIRAVNRLYNNIFAQCSDMLWKDGGPIVGVQIENECRGPWSYYMTLKDMAVRIGFDVPFYTRTGWPKLNGKEEFGKMLPLYGDYADGFWDRQLTDMPGEYTKAFEMKETRISGSIATETFGNNQDTNMDKKDLQYPYLTCELGGGMMPSYHRRIHMNGHEPLSLAICKLGSGSNMPGYYMYHGGTNPLPSNPDYASHFLRHATMGETQRSPITNYNDMPIVTYDFQCPLGEFGQPQFTAFHETRLLHQFLHDWGEELTTMEVDSLSKHYARRGCFEFYNDYVRIKNEGGTRYVRPVNMPFCGHHITADAQPVAKTGSTIYFIPIEGRKPVIYIDNRKIKVQLDKQVRIGDIAIVVMSPEKARRTYFINGKPVVAPNSSTILYPTPEGLEQETWTHTQTTISTTKVKEYGPLREIVLGKQKVASMPTDKDFDNAAVWQVTLPDSLVSPDTFLEIDYQGDVARIYQDKRLVQDNFWNGQKMLVRTTDLKNGNVTLHILPLQKEAPIYLQAEQRQLLQQSEGPLIKLNSVTILKRNIAKYSE